MPAGKEGDGEGAAGQRLQDRSQRTRPQSALIAGAVQDRKFLAPVARFIGQPVNPLQISAVVRSQIFKEAAVARQPEPVIDVQISPGGAAGTVYVYIRYVDAESSQTQVLTFSVTA